MVQCGEVRCKQKHLWLKFSRKSKKYQLIFDRFVDPEKMSIKRKWSYFAQALGKVKKFCV